MHLSELILIYLDSPRINRLTNVAAHFRALAGFAAQAGMPVSSRVAFSADEARRALQGCQADILYLLGHSQGHGGVVIGGKAALDGRALAAWLPRRIERLPRVIVFNTCDALSSGLVNAALAAGVSSLAAATGSIPISAMCTYGESLFRSWLSNGAPLS